MVGYVNGPSEISTSNNWYVLFYIFLIKFICSTFVEIIVPAHFLHQVFELCGLEPLSYVDFCKIRM